MKKLVISDYDDTLFTTKEDLDKNIVKIKEFQEKGNLFIISTSRSWNSIHEEIKKYNIPYDYVCCNMGAGIFDKTGKQIYANFISPFEKNLVEQILKQAEKNIEVTRFGIPDVQDENSDKIVGYKIKSDVEVLEKLIEKLNVVSPYFKVNFKKDDKKVFLNNLSNTKEKGIEKLRQLCNLEDYEVITVGDDDVDFNMIKKYNGYRMEKSSEMLVNNINKKVFSVSELLVV